MIVLYDTLKSWDYVIDDGFVKMIFKSINSHYTDNFQKPNYALFNKPIRVLYDYEDFMETARKAEKVHFDQEFLPSNKKKTLFTRPPIQFGITTSQIEFVQGLRRLTLG